MELAFCLAGLVFGVLVLLQIFGGSTCAPLDQTLFFSLPGSLKRRTSGVESIALL